MVVHDIRNRYCHRDDIWDYRIWIYYWNIVAHLTQRKIIPALKQYVCRRVDIYRHNRRSIARVSIRASRKKGHATPHSFHKGSVSHALWMRQVQDGRGCMFRGLDLSEFHRVLTQIGCSFLKFRNYFTIPKASRFSPS